MCEGEEKVVEGGEEDLDLGSGGGGGGRSELGRDVLWWRGTGFRVKWGRDTGTHGHLDTLGWRHVSVKSELEFEVWVADLLWWKRKGL